MKILISRYTKFILKIVLTLAVFFFLFHTSQLKFELLATIFHNPLLFSSTITLFVLGIFFSAYRWYLLNSAQNILINYPHTVIATYVGLAFNYLLPGAVGGDIVRSYYLFKKAPNQKSAGLISVFLDRMLGFIGLMFLICTVVIFHMSQLHKQPHLFYLLFLFALFCASVLIVFLSLMVLPHRFGLINALDKRYPNKRWATSLVSLLNALKTFQLPKIIILKCLIVSIVLQLLATVAIMLIANIMGLPQLGIADYIIAFSITQVVNLIPATPGGIGMGEMAFANILLLLNPGQSAAYATVYLAYRLTSMLTYIPGVICYIPQMMMLKKKDPENLNVINYNESVTD
ncbi:MAG: flippase-like domain-containing protein [Gammaproteobacteria bacterium]|nr:flippase-like domain-containing protein [Gammaproteobacteria bacterium]